jgi:PLD-like domain
MIVFHQKGIDAIQKAAEGATSGLICTPYYSERGLALLDSFFETAEEVDFWTRFSPLDWRAGVADMAALRKRVQAALSKGRVFNFQVSDDLHAKIYKFSNDKVIIGSANLTWPAMTSNIETICELTEGEASSILKVLSIFGQRLTRVDAEIFIAYVDIVADAIAKPSDGLEETNEEMNAAIDLAEEELRKSLIPTAPRASPIPPLEIEHFIDYCREEKSSVSKEIIARWQGKHNLQGHVKHYYYGALRFFSEFPQLVDEISVTPRRSLYEFTNPAVLTSWRDFLRTHAKEIDKKHNFSFRTLRVYTPENLGGMCTGGGGGSPTLKRVLPVAARMLKVSGKNR